MADTPGYGRTVRLSHPDRLFEHRTVHAQVPPRVDYELTELGASLLEPLTLLRLWAEDHVPSILKARDAYDDAQDEAVIGG